MATSHEAIVQAQEGPPYTGKAGQTRLDTVHLAADDGSVRVVKVHRVINVSTHPELLDRVLGDELHRVEGGHKLALPFVFHDPEQRKFALVIPPEVAHLELKEWANLMQELAEDTSAPVPRYVREAMTVIGLPSLARYLEAPAELEDSELSEASSPGARQAPPEVTEGDGDDGASVATVTVDDSALAAREQALEERERQLREREEHLVDNAEKLTAKEGDLLQLEERLASRQMDLEMREQELQRERPSAPTEDDAGWREVAAEDVSEPAPQAPQSGSPLTQAGVGSSLPGPRQSGPPPLRSRRQSGPPPLRPRGRVPAKQPPPLLGQLTADLSHGVLSIAHAGVSIGTGVHPHPHQNVVRPPPLPEVVDDAELVEIPSGAIAAETVHRSEAHPEVEPPGGAVAASPARMTHRLVSDELWLFARWPEAELDKLRASPDLMLQCVEVGDCPVLVLSLYAHGVGTAGNVARAALGATDAHGRAVLEYLERSFRARIAIYVGETYRETLTVSMLREGVARAVREHIESRFPNPSAGPSPVAIDAAVDRVLAAPPALDSDDLPFGPARRQMAGTFAVSAAVEQLHSWMLPERLREATLRFGVPQHVIEASARRVLRAAVVYGVALPRDLSELAVRYSVGRSEQSLVVEQLKAFRERIARGENDLDPLATQRNWERLFHAADRLAVAVDPALRELAEQGGATGESAPAEVPPRPLEALTTAEVRERLETPEERVEAFLELCLRGHGVSLPALMTTLESLMDGDLFRCAPHLLRFGEAAVEPLVGALDSERMPVRHAAALLLGRLRNPRALARLLRQLEQEPTAIWSEMARAIGEFGTQALPEVTRALGVAEDAERLTVTLAHLANHGCATEIENLENDPHERVARAARAAMARRSRLEWEDLAIREQRELNHNSPTAQFSQTFYAEVPRATAPR